MVDVTSVLVSGRAAAESRMTETVTAVTRTEVSDPTTHAVTFQDSAPIYEGPARYKSPARLASDTREAGQLVVAQVPELHIPSSSLDLPIGTVVTIESSSSDVSLVGLEVVISGRPEAGQTTAHRYLLHQEAR